jgi:hypothetical protein
VTHFFTLLLPFLYGLLIAGALFSDLASWRCVKTAYLLCGRRGLLTLSAVYCVRWGWVIMSCVWLVDLLPPHSHGLDLPIMMYLLCGAAGVLAHGAFSLWRWRRSEESIQVARGAFCDGVEAVRRKAGMKSAPSIYLLPDGYIAPSGYYAYRAPGTLNIRIPRHFLDWLSRGEVDALVALQFAWRQALRPARWAFLSAIVCSFAAAVAVDVLKAGSSRQMEVFLVLLALELLALTIWWPRLQSGTDLHAIEIAGDPDVYLSAMVKLYRLSGSSPDQRYLSRIARTAGIPPERLRNLLQEELRPAEDRYPTSGDYMTVGF